jgi:hypothetical protein
LTCIETRALNQVAPGALDRIPCSCPRGGSALTMRGASAYRGDTSISVILHTWRHSGHSQRNGYSCELGQFGRHRKLSLTRPKQKVASLDQWWHPRQWPASAKPPIGSPDEGQHIARPAVAVSRVGGRGPIFGVGRCSHLKTPACLAAATGLTDP